jgi:hypothetical protein
MLCVFLSTFLYPVISAFISVFVYSNCSFRSPLCRISRSYNTGYCGKISDPPMYCVK